MYTLEELKSIVEKYVSGTTAVVAKKLGRHYLGYEIVKDYCDIANERLSKVEDKNGI